SAPNHPVYLSRVDGQTGWANRRALEAAGLWAPGPDPIGGKVVRNRDGRPTGILLGRANEPLVALLPALADNDIVRAYRLGAEELAGRGVARAYDAGVLAAPGIVALNLDFGRYAALLARADGTEPLPLELSLMIPAPSPYADSVLGWDPARHQLSPRVRITHLKLFVDGALGSRSAALSHPYADDPSTSGLIRMTTPEIVALARRALDRNLGVAAHAIGDNAVTRVLDAYEELLRSRPGLDSRRLRIEHFSYASESDMQRAVRLGIVLSVHSNFNAHPGDNSGFEPARVGAGNANRVYAWDRLARMGARLAEGSDYFTRPTADALHQVAATMSRTNTVGAAYPDSAARLIAWKLHATWHPAAGPAAEPVLRAGAAADLVVLQRDPFTVARDRFETTRVVATLRSGAFTWQSFGFRSRHGGVVQHTQAH
ncbi:MAG: amidohydrolase, partial [Gemmatimonadales bacterium]